MIVCKYLFQTVLVKVGYALETEGFRYIHIERASGCEEMHEFEMFF